MSLTPQQQERLLQQIRQHLQQGTADINRCSKQLEQLKLLQLPTVAAAAAPHSGGDVSALLLARSTFETAAMLCVYQLQQRQQQQQQQGDEGDDELMAETAAAFQRHMNMLLPFYSDLANVLPPSDVQLELQCLLLLHFLSSDCIAELHVAYDRLSEEARSSPYVQTVMQLEQRLMAGNYEVVMQQQQQQQQQNASRSTSNTNQQQQQQQQLPPSAAVFLSQLTKTVRLLVAGALEAAYSSLPLSYVAAKLHLPAAAVAAFCDDQNSRRRQREAQSLLLTSPSIEFAAAAAAAAASAADTSAAAAPGGAAAAAAAPRLLQLQHQQQQQSISTLAAGVGSGSFAAAVSYERNAPIKVLWGIKGDRVYFEKEELPTQHCALHATHVAAHLIGYATELERII